MATLNVLRTTGKCSEILKEKNDDVIHLFIASQETCHTTTNHEIGDLLQSEESDTRFALLVKEYIDGKIITEALRVSIIELLTHITTEKMTQKYILISQNEFLSTREEMMFLCTLREFLTIVFTDMRDDEGELSISVIIADYKD
jgi:hypothetical protein